MSLGKLTAEVLLDTPLRIYRGRDGQVTGRVALGYRGRKDGAGSAGRELFGPLRVEVTFYGVLVSNVQISPSGGGSGDRGGGGGRASPPPSSSSSTERHDRLFESRLTVFDGGFRAAPGDDLALPFEFAFPDTVQPVGVSFLDGSGNWRTRLPAAGSTTGELLPPSCVARGFGEGPISWVQIAYYVQAQMEMPGIDVDLAVLLNERGREVRYQPLRIGDAGAEIPTTSLFRDRRILKLVTAKIAKTAAPTPAPPQGFGQRARAMFHSGSGGATKVPYKFAVVCTLPENVQQGEPVRFEVGIEPLKDNPSDLPRPEIWLEGGTFLVSLVTSTSVALVNAAGRPLYPDDGPQTAEVTTSLGSVVGPDGPFAEQYGMKKGLMTKPLPVMSTSPSFRFRQITRSHALHVKFNVLVAGKTYTVSGGRAVVVLLPVEQSPSYEGPAAPFEARPPSFEDGQSLPQYRP